MDHGSFEQFSCGVLIHLDNLYYVALGHSDCSVAISRCKDHCPLAAPRQEVDQTSRSSTAAFAEPHINIIGIVQNHKPGASALLTKILCNKHLDVRLVIS